MDDGARPCLTSLCHQNMARGHNQRRKSMLYLRHPPHLFCNTQQDSLPSKVDFQEREESVFHGLHTFFFQRFYSSLHYSSSTPSPCPFKHSLKTAVQSAVHFPGQTQGTAVWMQENLMADRMTIDKTEDRFPPPPLPPSFIPFPIAS